MKKIIVSLLICFSFPAMSDVGSYLMAKKTCVNEMNDLFSTLPNSQILRVEPIEEMQIQEEQITRLNNNLFTKFLNINSVKEKYKVNIAYEVSNLKNSVFKIFSCTVNKYKDNTYSIAETNTFNEK